LMMTSVRRLGVRRSKASRNGTDAIATVESLPRRREPPHGHRQGYAIHLREGEAIRLRSGRRTAIFLIRCHPSIEVLIRGTRELTKLIKVVR